MPVATTDGLWVTCKHVVQGIAKEVWAAPDGYALCCECAERDEDTIPLDDLVMLCAACLLSDVTLMRVRGREFIERDAMRYGHTHDHEAN